MHRSGKGSIPTPTTRLIVPSSSYAPDEPYGTIVREETWLQGTLLSNFLFGIQTALCVLAFRAVLRRRNTKYSRMQIALLVYIAILFALTTAAQGLILNWIQMGFITERNYRGGPDAFLRHAWSIPVNFAPNILVVFANWMMESLLVWRCHVVCSTGERLWRLGVAISLLLLIAVFVIGSLVVHQIIHTTPTVGYIIAYGISSLVLNLVATGFIAGRLLAHRRRVVSQLGRAHCHHYVSIATVMIESAAVYSAFLVLIIVAYAVESPITNLLAQVIIHVQAITSFFILWRIARGEGWTRARDAEVSAVWLSSSSVRVGLQSEPNVIRLEVLSMGRDGPEEGRLRQAEDQSKASLPTSGAGEVRSW